MRLTPEIAWILCVFWTGHMVYSVQGKGHQKTRSRWYRSSVPIYPNIVLFCGPPQFIWHCWAGQLHSDWKSFMKIHIFFLIFFLNLVFTNYQQEVKFVPLNRAILRQLSLLTMLNNWTSRYNLLKIFLINLSCHIFFIEPMLWALQGS